MSEPEPPAAPAPDPETPSAETPPARAAHWAALVGSAEWADAFRTVKVRVPRERWVEAHRALQPHLPFFAWLSAIDWSNEVAVGDPLEGEPVEERYEVISRLSDVSAGEAVILSTDLPPDDLTIDSLAGVYTAADWHEREAADMFGITFVGHPNPVRIYLSEGFVGHPLRKSYPLLAREVKAWPGAVEVTPLPAAEGSAGEPKEGGA
ncbi:MAG: NADH-quinone oxidoreductase subunit C [Acidimicrobiia bacterium]|nr:NADH-quinone oxidoreductase subunit C [Acidimicrobiia bacterium]